MNEKELGWAGGGSQFGLPISQNLGPCEKLLFEPHGTAYSSKPCSAISLIIS